DIVVGASLFSSPILATEFSFAALLSAVGRFLATRAQVARTAWDHFLETRRKERMGRDVGKKHAQEKDKEAGDTESVPGVRRVKSPAGPGAEEAEPARAAQKP